jgi:hypothetical protein
MPEAGWTEIEAAKHGGLWRGGTVVVTGRGVSLAPNGLNRAFHDELQTISVPAADIHHAVRHELNHAQA